MAPGAASDGEPHQRRRHTQPFLVSLVLTYALSSALGLSVGAQRLRRPRPRRRPPQPRIFATLLQALSAGGSPRWPREFCGAMQLRPEQQGRAAELATARSCFVDTRLGCARFH